MSEKEVERLASIRKVTLAVREHYTPYHEDERVAALLCDLLHYCEANRVDFRKEMELAREWYREEK